MPQNFQKKILTLINDQIHDWPLARNNYDGLKEAETRLLTSDEKHKIFVQFNPGRIRSSAAKVDARSISERPCFLCQGNLPEEQKGVTFNEQYTVLVNPFPIFPQHLTIPHSNHTPQRIDGKVGDMLGLARELPGFVLFYNGPRCGASAPDHFHFQAIGKGNLPLEDEVTEALQNEKAYLDKDTSVVAMENYGRKVLIVKSGKKEVIEEKFDRVYHFLQAVQPQEAEPMLNVLCWREINDWVLVILPRQAHRPWQFDAGAPEKIVLSPASVDLGGVLITPRKEDFDKLDIETVQDIFSQVCIDDESWKKLVE
jgi:ATP adenylyltransferase/5',5'''-P-1,P-4-tetraphosphate phosphorylase II